jgi:predicted metal-dependent phosphoesterase TrpH
MLRVEFHCHTIYSRDSLARPESLLAACRRKGIDRLVVTDHNTIAGAQRCQELDPQRAIVGEEVLTRHGELLAAYVQEEVPAGLEPVEAIQRLRDQGAFISVSHPFDVMRKGHWPLEILLEIAPLVDAIETFNARCFAPIYNTQAQRFAEKMGLLGTVGSDAHTLFEVGRATMRLPDFHDAASLRASLPLAQMDVRQSSPWVHVTSRFAVWVKKKQGTTE